MGKCRQNWESVQFFSVIRSIFIRHTHHTGLVEIVICTDGHLVVCLRNDVNVYTILLSSWKYIIDRAHLTPFFLLCLLFIGSWTACSAGRGLALRDAINGRTIFTVLWTVMVTAWCGQRAAPAISCQGWWNRAPKFEAGCCLDVLVTMAIGCGLKCSKGVLLTFNLLFWLSGGVFLVVGIWIILDPTKTHLFHLTATEDVAVDLLQYLGYFLVAISCVIFLVGFCGCCGSLYERRCVLITYFVFLFLLLCAELSVSVATLIYREDFLTGLENRLLNRFKNLYGTDSSVFTQAIDQAQYTFNCCGILSDADYTNTKWRNESVGISNRSRISVPLTCCIQAHPDVEESWQHPQPKDETACQDTEVNKNQLARHRKGCLEDLEKWFKEDTTILIGLGIGIAFFHMVGMIFSIGLCRNIGDGLAQGHWGHSESDLFNNHLWRTEGIVTVNKISFCFNNCQYFVCEWLFNYKPK